MALTYNIQKDVSPEDWRCVDLALVRTPVRELDRVDGQGPLLGVGLVEDPDAGVLAVLVLADGDQADVVVSDPRHLKKEGLVWIEGMLCSAINRE